MTIISIMTTMEICVAKSWNLIMKSKDTPVGEKQEFIRKIMSVDSNWSHIMEQMGHGLYSKATFGSDGLRIYQLSIRKNNEVSIVFKKDYHLPDLKEVPQEEKDPIPNTQSTKLQKLKVILYHMTARETQHIKLFNILDEEIPLMMTELNTTLHDRNNIQKRFQEVVEIKNSLENEVDAMRKAVEAINFELLEAKEAVRSGEKLKVDLEILQAENKALKEVVKTIDNEMLQLIERIASTEEISKQLHQQLNSSKNELHRQTQLLETAITENNQICTERKELTTENELLRREVDQLKEVLDLQLKQENDSETAQEKTAAEGSDNIDGPSGYPKDIFTEEVDDKYLCTRCCQILKNPIQSFCGHRFCKDCFDHLIRSDGGQVICPRCSDECEDAAENALEQSKMFPDMAIKRELNSMRTKCVFENCKWSGSFKEYEEHCEKCDQRPRRCDTCGKKIPNNQFDGHNCRPPKLDGGRECKYQCGKPVTELDFELHLKQLLPEHFEALFSRIQKVTSIICSYSLPLGRPEKPSDWIPTIENLVKSFEDKIQKQLESLTARGTDASVRKTQINERRAIESGRAITGAEAGVTGGATGGPVEGSSAAVGLSQTPRTNDVLRKLDKLSADMRTCESLLTTLDREVENDYRVMETLQAKEATLKMNMESLAQMMKSTDRVLSLKGASLADLDKRVRDLEQTSYDGSLLWQLTDFQRKRQEAIQGRTTSVYSPPFYTSKTGYKMCARLYLNGDGMGKGTHISLFFVVMRGQFDALLKWPFRQKVTLMFLDQSGKDQHVMDAFRPDPTSSSFKRPTTEMNIASGCPLFMSLMQLDNPFHTFVKDDTAFVKIVVSREEI